MGRIGARLELTTRGLDPWVGEFSTPCPIWFTTPPPHERAVKALDAYTRTSVNHSRSLCVPSGIRCDRIQRAVFEPLMIAFAMMQLLPDYVGVRALTEKMVTQRTFAFLFAKRLRGSRAIGYARGDAPLGCSEPADEITVTLRVRRDRVQVGGGHEDATAAGNAPHIPMESRAPVQPCRYQGHFASSGDIPSRAAPMVTWKGRPHLNFRRKHHPQPLRAARRDIVA